MGNFLSFLQEKAERVFDHRLNFRNAETEPSELVQLRYHPIFDGQFQDETKHIFHWIASPFFFTEPFCEIQFRKYRRNFRQAVIPKHLPSQVDDRGTLATRFSIETQLFRPNPVDWEKFELFKVYPSLDPSGERIRFVRETEDQKCEKSVPELLEYLRRLKQQFLYGFLLNKLELDGDIMGVYTSPFCNLDNNTKGVLLSFLNERPTIELRDNWMKNFDWLKKIDSDLPNYLEVLDRNSEKNWERFYFWLSFSATKFRDDLSLDDESYWHNERLMNTYAANLKTYTSLLILMTGFLEHSCKSLWRRLKKTNQELAKFMELCSKP